MSDGLFSRMETEQIIVLERLHLYNQGFPCGPNSIRQIIDIDGVRPLPSLTTIKRILSRHHLTYGRTGLYP